jgi:hypothetical protein
MGTGSIVPIMLMAVGESGADSSIGIQGAKKKKFCSFGILAMNLKLCLTLNSILL